MFGTWLAERHPEVGSCADLERHHIEQFKGWLATHPRPRTGKPLCRTSIKEHLINLHCFFDRTAEWGYPNPPQRPLIFTGDLPIIDKPLPRFLDDAAAAKLLRVARADTDPLARLVTELLARTGVRRSELLELTVDAVVQIGSAFWLRIPVGKLHNDRYIPLHPQLKELLDDWVNAHRPTDVRSDRLLIERNRPLTGYRVGQILRDQAAAAGIGHVTPHQLRHTLATQAINRGMSLDAIAALLGHKTLAMTMVYARIADKTVADEYFAVTEKVEALYDQPRRLPSDNEGTEMRKLRGEMHRRMLGNGYCARPVEMDCHFESICESCTFFVTTIEFRPTLQRQREDAATKGQVARTKIFDGLLDRLDHDGPEMLDGIDGLQRHGNSLIAIRNGVAPHAIVRIGIDASGRRVRDVELLERAHPDWGEPTLGTIHDDTLFYIADARWADFGESGALVEDAAPRPTAIRALSLTNRGRADPRRRVGEPRPANRSQ